MMKFRVILSLISILLSAHLLAQQNIINDPNAEVRNLKGFHAIEVSNAIDLFISQADEEVVAVSCKDLKYRDHIVTEVDNGVLKIKFVNTGLMTWNMGNKKLKAYVSFKALDHLNASGASNVFVKGVISGDRLQMDLSGASDFKGTVKLNELQIEQSGASDVAINGSVINLHIKATGASDIKGYDLVTDHCFVDAAGASDIRITVNKELNAHASGASSIYYRGEGIIREFKSSGASSISKRS